MAKRTTARRTGTEINMNMKSMNKAILKKANQSPDQLPGTEATSSFFAILAKLGTILDCVHFLVVGF